MGYGIWDLCSSKSGNKLLKKYKINSYDKPSSEKLIEEIEELFEIAGVGWTEEPLIRISSVR